jgi:hydroxymethylglutaryl-CoA lyase
MKLPRLTDVLTDLSLREASQQECDLRGASVETKIELARLSAAAGVRTMEVTAFAPGAWFADAPKLAAALPDIGDVTWRALYFNVRGLEDLLREPKFAREGMFHTAVTAGYREKNYRQKNPAAVLEKLKQLLDAFAVHNLEFDTLLLSTAWGEPGEAITPDSVRAFCEPIFAEAERAGRPLRAATVCDTIGNASPREIGELFSKLKEAWPAVELRAHLHPPISSAKDCIGAALDAGIVHWEAAWCGMGGSPLADRPGGNLDIRALIEVWGERGGETGFDAAAVKRLTDFLRRSVKRTVI